MNSSYLNDLLEIVQSLEWAKPQLKGKKVFITGGTGFLGRWIVDTLLQLGARPTLLTRSREKALKSNEHWKNSEHLTWVEGDLNELPIFGGKFDIVIHAANDLTLTAEAALKASKQIFDFSEKAGAKLVLFLSSGAVYQTGNAPLNSYAESKILIEQEGNRRASHGSFEFKIARCFAFLGPHQDLDSHFAAAQFFSQVIQGKAITIQGDGSPIRSYLYPTDFVVGVIQILLKGRSGQAYDLGSKEAVKIVDLAKLINECRPGEIPPVNVLHQGSKSLSQSNVYLPNLDLIENELNFKPKVNLSEAVKRTSQFYQECGLIK